jgi:hypothetical protein
MDAGYRRSEKMQVIKWWEKIQRRDKWGSIVSEAKAHSEL